MPLKELLEKDFNIAETGRKRLFIPFAKSQDKEDGTIDVFGYGSTEAEDQDGEVVTLDAVKKAFEDYKDWGSIWEMHQPWVAGVMTDHEFDKKGLYLKANIADPAAVAKVKNGSYKGFSIGGKKLAKEGNKVTSITIREFSLVDRPCNPDTVIDEYKLFKVSETGEVEVSKELEKGVPEKKEVKVEGIVKPVVTVEELTKRFNTVKDLASCVEMLGYIRDSVVQELSIEGHESTFPEQIKEIIGKLGSLLVEYTQEEVNETVEQTQAEGGLAVEQEIQLLAKSLSEAKDVTGIVTILEDLQKKGARFSKANLAELEDIHKSLGECHSLYSKIHKDLGEVHGKLGKFMGKEDAPLGGKETASEGKAEDKVEGKKEGENKKAADTTEDLQKVVLELKTANEELAKRLAVVEKQPEAPKTVSLQKVEGVTKSDELTPDETAAVIKVDDLKKRASEGDEKARLELTKVCLTGRI